MAAQLNSLVEPRHTVGRHIPPAVNAHQRKSEDEGETTGKEQLVARVTCYPMANGHSGKCCQGSRDARVYAEVVRPLCRREGQEEHGADEHEHQACRRTGQSPRNGAVTKQRGNRDAQARQCNQNRETTREGAVDRLQHQPVVADELVVPRLRRADDAADANGLADRGQSLVAEDTDQDGGARSQERCNLHQWGLPTTTESLMALNDNAHQHRDACEQGGNCH